MEPPKPNQTLPSFDRPESLLAHPPIENQALVVDMNSFFASVEQQVHPELRGKPVAVCPFVNDSTCVIAASIEAKRYGVKTGTKIPEARRLCPHIIFLEDTPRIYRQYHRWIMDYLQSTRCHVFVKSIDEALLVLPREMQATPLELAQEIRQQIYLIGSQLRCSIGISSNFFLAKMGSNLIKPDGLTQIQLKDLEEFYSLLQLTDLHGISWRMARRLEQMGITTPLELYRAPHTFLKNHLGQIGEAWYLRLRGYEVDIKLRTRRSIGHQTTIVPKPAHTKPEVLSIASQLTYKVASRLRAAGLSARGVVVYVRFIDRTYWQRVWHGKVNFYDSITSFEHVQRLLRDLRMTKPVRLVSVTAIDLQSQEFTPLELFADQASPERLSTAIDHINSKFGPLSILSAGQLLTGNVQDRVGFGNAGQVAREVLH